MPPGIRCSFSHSKHDSSSGNCSLKWLTVYRKCFGIDCLTRSRWKLFFMTITVCQIFYLMSRDNYLYILFIIDDLSLTGGGLCGERSFGGILHNYLIYKQ